jgi:hypothetical protein
MQLLFATIARTHGVSVDEARGLLGQRPRLFDAATILSFAIVYVARVRAPLPRLSFRATDQPHRRRLSPVRRPPEPRPSPQQCLYFRPEPQ